MTDVWLFHEPDGGNIAYQNGQAVMTGGLEGAIYLSLFGGNERDTGEQDGERYQFWGNLGEQVESRKLRSRTQNLLRGLPAISSNLRRLEGAAKDDLEWLTDEGWASYISVSCSITARNTVRYEISGESDGERWHFEWTRGWGAVETPTDLTPAPASGVLDFSDPANSHWLLLF